MKRFLTRVFGKIVAAPLKRKLRKFDRLAENPEAVQRELLFRILRDQANTGFGKDHHFGDIKTIDDYRRNVPVAPYEYVAPYIERVRKGEIDALLSDPTLLMFALTSGSTDNRKLIPVTPRYLADYRKGWSLWGMQAMRNHRPIILRPMLHVVGDAEEYRTEAGIPCGNLSGYTAQVQKRYIRFLYANPAVAGKIKDSEARYYVALRFGLMRRLGMIIAANPSTLLVLGRALDRHKERLIRDILDGTLSDEFDIPADVRRTLTEKLKKDRDLAIRLDQLAEATGHLFPKDVWPPERLLLGTWTGGSVGLYLRQLPKFYGEPFIRDLGLLASEGRMTLPLEDNTSAGVLDITTHYFEFIPEAEIDSEQPTVLGAHELEDGGAYYIVPTTAAGLYRYHISDLVRVNGFRGKTPKVEFLGKGHRFANLTGEKLSEYHVTKAMAAVLNELPQPVSAYALAPCWDESKPYYGLFLEEGDVATSRGSTARFLEALDRELCQRNLEYEAKRRSDRLGPVRLMVMRDGFWGDWDRQRLKETGGSPEQYKRPCLMGDVSFRQGVTVKHEIAPAPADLVRTE